MKRILITLILLISGISTAYATSISGIATLNGNTDQVGVTSGDYIKYFIPLNDFDGIYGDGGFGTVSDCVGIGCGSDSQISGGTLSMFLYFNIPTGQEGTTLTLDFNDLDLKTHNDPSGFFERLTLHGPSSTNLPEKTFETYSQLDSVPDTMVTSNWETSSIEFSNLSIQPGGGDFWLELGFEAYSVGLQSGTWCNTPELIKATLTTATAPVPEPATMLLFGTGLAGLAGYRKRKAMKK